MDPLEELYNDSCLPKDRTRVLASTEYTTSIGPFPKAHDLLGDGSIYIIDSFGHLQGHINVLARTSADGSWIYLAGDSAHDRRILSGEKGIRVIHDSHGNRHCAHVDKEAAEAHILRIAAVGELPKVQVILAHDYAWYEANKSHCVFPGVIPPK